MNRTTLFGLMFVGAATAAAQQPITPHPLGTTQATSKEVMAAATLARALPNGSVIINDIGRRRLLLLDPTLQTTTVIADSTAGSTNGYGQRPGALIPYVADSTLFLDAMAGSFLVIDPAGKVVRVMSPPRPSDNFMIARLDLGFPGFDAKGRMVYRTNFPRSLQQHRDGSIQSSPAPDSAPIIRVDLDTRRADTIGTVKLPKMISTTGTMPNGGTFTMANSAPLATIDDWTVLADGSIAILRGRDYHIDWILPDGSKKSTGKLAFDWKRLTDDDKLALIDSISKAPRTPGGMDGAMMFAGGEGMRVMMGGGGRGEMVTREVVASAATAGPPGPPPAVKADAKSGDGKAVPPDAKTPPDTKNAANAATTGDKPGAMTMGLPPGMTLGTPAASDLPDYMPVFTGGGAARADADGNIWVRTTAKGSVAGNVVYDVINNQGELVDRVDVPRGMTIIGFGRGGMVYLTERGPGGFRVVRAPVR